MHLGEALLLRRAVNPSALRAAIVAHLGAFAHLYGEAEMKPKFHFSLHIADLVEKLNMAPACFALERKHKLPKRFGDIVRNTASSWDTGVHRDVTCAHMVHLQDLEPHAFSEGARLVEPRAPKTALERTLRNDFGIPSDVPLFIAREARCSEHERIFKHDIVMTSEPELTLGEVQMLFSVGDVTLSVLQKWAIAADETRAWKCTISGDFVLVRVEHITCALIWGGRSSQRKTVLKPLRS